MNRIFVFSSFRFWIAPILFVLLIGFLLLWTIYLFNKFQGWTQEEQHGAFEEDDFFQGEVLEKVKPKDKNPSLQEEEEKGKIKDVALNEFKNTRFSCLQEEGPHEKPHEKLHEKLRERNEKVQILTAELHSILSVIEKKKRQINSLKIRIEEKEGKEINKKKSLKIVRKKPQTNKSNPERKYQFGTSSVFSSENKTNSLLEDKARTYAKNSKNLKKPKSSGFDLENLRGLTKKKTKKPKKPKKQVFKKRIKHNQKEQKEEEEKEEDGKQKNLNKKITEIQDAIENEKANEETKKPAQVEPKQNDEVVQLKVDFLEPPLLLAGTQLSNNITNVQPSSSTSDSFEMWSDFSVSSESVFSSYDTLEPQETTASPTSSCALFYQKTNYKGHETKIKEGQSIEFFFWLKFINDVKNKSNPSNTFNYNSIKWKCLPFQRLCLTRCSTGSISYDLDFSEIPNLTVFLSALSLFYKEEKFTVLLGVQGTEISKRLTSPRSALINQTPENGDSQRQEKEKRKNKCNERKMSLLSIS